MAQEAYTDGIPQDPEPEPQELPKPGLILVPKDAPSVLPFGAGIMENLDPTLSRLTLETPMGPDDILTGIYKDEDMRIVLTIAKEVFYWGKKHEVRGYREFVRNSWEGAGRRVVWKAVPVVTFAFDHGKHSWTDILRAEEMFLRRLRPLLGGYVQEDDVQVLPHIET